MKWRRLACPFLSLAALLVVASCGLGVGGARDSESRRGGGTDGTAGTSQGRAGGSSSSSSGTVGSSSSSSSSNGGGTPSGASSSSGRDSRRYHRVQHGQCTYTFILPEGDVGGGSSCRESKSSGTVAAGGATYSSGGGGGGGGGANVNAVQRDAPPLEPDFPTQKIQQLEHVMENYTQWLQKIENYIRESMKLEMAQLQQSAVNNHTDAMLKMGTSLNSLTSLLSRTAEQARKLTDVETQVLNQTSRLEIQLLENSLSTNKLEKQLMLQTNEISKLHDKNGFLEQKMQEMEGRHREELEALREEKGSLQALVGRQIGVIRQLEGQLGQATGNSTALQRQQQDLMDTVHNLLNLCAKDGVIPNSTKQTAAAEEEKTFKDCAELFKAGFQKNGVYTIQISNLEPRKVYCNMESAGGGWTVIQHREDGSVDFHRTWKEYKMGFGGVSGEHWLGNEFVYLLTSQRQYALRVELTDWDGHQAYSQYDRFHIGTEKQNYRLFLKSHTGTAGRLSSLVIHGADFSTKDVDNDNCMCKCALMLTGGWWFDACGPSNLNGMYYTQGQHVGKLNGIKWHYFKGPSYSLRATRMMIRPLDFL